MKKGFKFNIIDLAVIIAVIGVLAFVGIKLKNGAVTAPLDIHKFEYSFSCGDVPDFVLEYLKVGDAVDCADNNDYFGNITAINIGESYVYAQADDGTFVKSTKPDHSGVEIIVEGTGEQTDTGVKLTKGVYGVGHTIVLKAGNAKVSGKVSGIKQLD